MIKSSINLGNKKNNVRTKLFSHLILHTKKSTKMKHHFFGLTYSLTLRLKHCILDKDRIIRLFFKNFSDVRNQHLLPCTVPSLGAWMLSSLNLYRH